MVMVIPAVWYSASVESSVTVNVRSCEPIPSDSVKSAAPSSFIISSPIFQTNESIGLSTSIELLPTRFTSTVSVGAISPVMVLLVQLPHCGSAIGGSLTAVTVIDTDLLSLHSSL